MNARSSVRRILAGTAMLTALAGLAACGTSSSSTQAKAAGNAPAWCGTKPIKFGMADGGGLNGWSKASAAAVREVVSQCPNVTKVLESDAGFDLQKAIAGLQGLVAQGANAIVVIPDAGGPGTELASIRAANSRGVAVVPWGADPGGTPGSDYLQYVDGDHRGAGVAWATWMAQQLPNGGQIAFFSGPPGNGPGLAELEGIKSVLKDHPNIQLVTGDNSWAVDNWDPAAGQQAAAALLSRYPDIKGVISDEGLTTTGILRAFSAANRPMPLVASLEANALACEFKDLKRTDNGIQLATVGAMNVAGRYAAQLAIAKAAGVTISAKDALSPTPLLPDPIFEDSVNGPAPICDHSADQSALLSNRITDSQLRVMTRTGKYPNGVGK